MRPGSPFFSVALLVHFANSSQQIPKNPESTMNWFKKKRSICLSRNSGGLTSLSIMPASLLGKEQATNAVLKTGKVIDINLIGTWLGVKYQIPAMLKSDGYAIFNMTSVAALMIFEGYSPYSASKWRIVGIIRVAGIAYAPKGIRVNSIAPGSIATPLFQDVINSTPNLK